jgi:RNA polymerase sigma-70 factor (ECF subfamily)
MDSIAACRPRPDPSAPVSFQRVYDEHSGKVRRWVRTLGARPSDVDDLVQDVFIVAYRRLAHFDGKNLVGWLYRIANRTVRDHRRLLWFKYYYSARSPIVLEEIGTDALTPLDQAEFLEQLERLEHALGKLSAVQRSAFVLFGVEGYTGQQIAEFQGIPINTVWSRIFKAKHTLQSRIARSARVRSPKAQCDPASSLHAPDGSTAKPIVPTASARPIT